MRFPSLPNLSACLDLVLFMLGLSFLLLATAFSGLRRSTGQRHPFASLALFALAQGFLVWVNLVSQAFNSPFACAILGALATLSLAALVETLRQYALPSNRLARGLWLHLLPPVGVSALLLLAHPAVITEPAAHALLLAAWAPLILPLTTKTLLTPDNDQPDARRRIRAALRFLSLAAILAILEFPLRLHRPSSLLPSPGQSQSHLTLLVFAQATFVILAAVTLRRELCSVCNQNLRRWSYRFDWAAIAILASLALGWIVTSQLGRVGQADLLDETSNVARLLEQRINARYAESERAVASLASAPSVINALASPNPTTCAIANELLDRYKRSWGFGICYLLHADGRGFLSSNRNTPQSIVGVDYRFRPYWQQAVQGHPNRYLAIGLTTRERGSYAAYPVRNAAGLIIGVAVIKRNLDDLEDTFRLYDRACLVSPEGIVFLAGRKTDALKALWPVPQDQLAALAASKQFGPASFDPIFPYHLRDGQFFTDHDAPHLLTQRPIDDAGWSIVCITPAHTIARYRLAGIALGAILCLLVLGFVWVTEQSRISDALLTVVDRRFRTILESSRLAALTIDSTGRITFCNDFFLAATHWTRDQLVGKDWFNTFRPDDQAGRQQFLNSLASGQLPSFDEYAIKTRSGDHRVFRWNRTLLRDVRGRVVGLSSIGEDVTDQIAMQQQLQIAAQTDRLTGLPNRTLLLQRLQAAIQRRLRSQHERYAVLFLDFDRFKLINDSLGHAAGDLLLTEIASRLRNAVRASDSVCRQSDALAARLGGDEFVILLEGLHAEQDANIVAERILSLLAQPFHLMDREIVSTASIGIVTSQMPAQSAEDVLRDADTAMYEAKAAGRGRFLLFDQTMRQRVQQHLTIESDLRRALELQQLSLLYQPIVSLDTGRVETVEALVRWNHPNHGLISPAQFIPIAEECGLILPIGHWVLQQACQQYARWANLPNALLPAGVSVNLSRAQLAMPDLPDLVAQVIADTRIDPAKIHLEITESAVMHNQDAAIKILRELKQIGVMLDLDDFGTGYSSLSSLHLFPLDVIKIDRSFIANLERGRDFAALVQAVTQLARNLGITVVAEGIENFNQLLMLQSLECAFGQGFLFSPPLPPHEAINFRMDLCALNLQRDAA